MAAKYMQVALTPSVQRAQDAYYGRHQTIKNAPETDILTPEETEFIETRDSFYLGTVSETGWPYIQHRGGPPGFLKVLAPNKLGFADYAGNRQMLSVGNLQASDRVALFLIDYPNRFRLKIMGHARVVDAREDSTLAAQLAPRGLTSKAERFFLIDVISYDWNCTQHITPRFTVEEIEEYAAPLKARIAELEAQLAALKSQ